MRAIDSRADAWHAIVELAVTLSFKRASVATSRPGKPGYGPQHGRASIDQALDQAQRLIDNQQRVLHEQFGFCLPIHPRMTEDNNAYICAALWKAVEQVRSH